MGNCTLCTCLSEYREIMVDGLKSATEKGGAYITALYAAVLAWFSGLVLSEALIVKTFLLSIGILIGAAFSDFVKKHRALFIFAACIALVAFLYRVFADMQDDEF